MEKNCDKCQEDIPDCVIDGVCPETLEEHDRECIICKALGYTEQHHSEHIALKNKRAKLVEEWIKEIDNIPYSETLAKRIVSAIEQAEKEGYERGKADSFFKGQEYHDMKIVNNLMNKRGQDANNNL